MKMTINFDMDGTIADLYGVENWLGYLIAENTLPYEIAKPLVNLAKLAEMLNAMKKNGYEIAVISWLSKNGTTEYNKAVTEAKMAWLRKNLPTVEWNAIHIVPYGTAKENFCKTSCDVLFDDEEHNRNTWTGKAYGVENILEILRNI